jgi:hypothetical protein
MEAAHGIGSAMRWKDLALDQLLPPDERQEERLKAEVARKMASGAQQPAVNAQVQTNANEVEQFEEIVEDEEEEDEEGEGAEDEDEDEDGFYDSAASLDDDDESDDV